MNRRGFLSQLFQTAGGILVAPSIVTHGLKLKPTSRYVWTAQENELYRNLPFYLAKIQVDRIQPYEIWTKLLDNRVWQPNMGKVKMFEYHV